MNKKSLPAILALVAGFFTCLMSFVQNVDIAVFAKRFIIACIVFFIIGLVIRILIDINFKEMEAEEDSEKTEVEETENEEGEGNEEAEEEKTAENEID